MRFQAQAYEMEHKHERGHLRTAVTSQWERVLMAPRIRASLDEHSL